MLMLLVLLAACPHAESAERAQSEVVALVSVSLFQLLLQEQCLRSVLAPGGLVCASLQDNAIAAG